VEHKALKLEAYFSKEKLINGSKLSTKTPGMPLDP
jgi:hypothetical protein